LPVQTVEQVVATMAKDQKGRFLSIQHFRQAGQSLAGYLKF
jgi:hypothetical protein